MKGLDAFETTRLLTLDELAQFMEQHWDKAQYGDFTVGHPTAPSSGIRYVILPASEHWCVIVYPKGPGLFNKKNRIKLACTYTSSGAKMSVNRGTDRHGASAYNSTAAKAQRAKNSHALTKEMRQDADPAMRRYAACLKQLLQSAGLA